MDIRVIKMIVEIIMVIRVIKVIKVFITECQAIAGLCGHLASGKAQVCNSFH